MFFSEGRGLSWNESEKEAELNKHLYPGQCLVVSLCQLLNLS